MTTTLIKNSGNEILRRILEKSYITEKEVGNITRRRERNEPIDRMDEGRIEEKI